MSDIKYALRKLEFPFCARESLVRIEHLMTGRSVPTAKQLDLIADLTREFVFCEVEWRDSRRAVGLNPLQELQLLDVFCEYFSGPLNETTKTTIFLSFFGGPESWKRMKFMCKLASMAISASIAPVLHMLGTWLQQTGCTSPPSLQLAHSLVRDYFILHPSHEGALKVLPNIAPQFVANFMSAVVEIYLKEGSGGTFLPPPISLLAIITFWVTSNPKLCFSANVSPSALPAGGIAMTAISPIAGLVQWCALAPLFLSIPQDPDIEMREVGGVSLVKKIKLEKPTNDDSIHSTNDTKANSIQSDLQLYAKLHLGVLQSLYESKRPQGLSATINAQHLAQVVPLILNKIEESKKPGNTPIPDSNLQVCLERVAQAAQIALACGCIYGNISNLFNILGTLPENRILQIVIKHHQQSS